MYKLNNIPLSDFGFIPGKQSDSNIALSGFLDMPERIGATSYDWAVEDGVEPYVSAGEIFFGGRTLNLKGYIKGLNRNDCEAKRSQLISLLGGFSDLVPFNSKWSNHNVYVKNIVRVSYKSPQYLEIEIPMREPVVTMTGTVPISTGSPVGIDGISFTDLGGAFIELAGDRRNRSAPKSETASAYGVESYLITKLVAPQLKLTLAIKQPTYAAMKDKVDSVMALFAAPGIRTITVPNDHPHSFFVKDGFKASKVYIKNGMAFCLIECNLTEVG